MIKYLFLVLLILLGGCQSTRTNQSTQNESADMNELTEYARSLIGTPYKYGGTSPDTGFDCSGFVGHVFKEKLGKTLPRSSAEISHTGIAQKSTLLQPGDLVFYNTLHKTYSHVGIYLGDGQFIHSPSKGKLVSIVNMDEPYWRKRYNGARRIRP
jgi:cell wall-associated NlpC family hydrolase